MSGEKPKTEIDRLIEKSKTYKLAGGRSSSDPEIIAGEFLDWKNGNIEAAIFALEIHKSGQYIDMPPFPGCSAAIELLEKMIPNSSSE